MVKLIKILVFISFLLTMSCAKLTNDYRYSNYASKDFIEQNQMAAENLSKQLLIKVSESQPKLSPMIVATFVNMNQLSKSSSFGRLVSEQVSARFSQMQYNIVEIKMRNDVLVKNNQGEFLLTREVKDIASSVNAQAVIVGTYVENTHDVYINLKVVQPTNNIVLAGYSYAIPKAANIKGMLND